LKLLHTSDWHLGRLTYNQSRAEDHDAVLAEIVQLARDERPDLIVHTGDLFDVPRPGYPDIERGLNALRELGAVAPVVVICGNHDSPALFRIFSGLLGDQARIRFVDRPRHPDDGGILEYSTSKGERIRLAPLPFIHANRIVDAFDSPDTWNADYADRVQGYEDILAKGLLAATNPTTDVLLFAAHLHVGGAIFGHGACGHDQRRLRNPSGAASRRELRGIRPYPQTAAASGSRGRSLRRFANPARLRRGR